MNSANDCLVGDCPAQSAKALNYILTALAPTDCLAKEWQQAILLNDVQTLLCANCVNQQDEKFHALGRTFRERLL